MAHDRDGRSRWTAFRAAVILNGITMGEAATQCGVSYTHLALVLKGSRKGSARLERAIADILRAVARR